MSTKYGFMGKIGHVSGFDAEPDASAVLILETLLAGYARVAIQSTKGTNIPLRPIEIGSHGRHFFLLPAAKNLTHAIFRIDLIQKEEKTKKPGDSKEFERTTIRSSLIPHRMSRVELSTVISETGMTMGKILEKRTEDPVRPKLDSLFGTDSHLYYIDIEQKDGWKGSTSDSFHMFTVRTTAVLAGSEQRVVTWKYLSFFARPAEVGAETNAIAQYLSHLMADNVSTEDIFPKVFNQDAVIKPFILEADGKMTSKEKDTMMIRVEGATRVPQNINPGKIEEGVIPPLPPGWSEDGFPIIPSVMFVTEKWYAMVPWSHMYATLLYKYITTIRDAFQYENSQIVGIKSLRQRPDYEIALGPHPGHELIIITTMLVISKMQHKAMIAIRDSCIARLLFGSSAEWEYEYQAKKGLSPKSVSTPGFGCLHRESCRIVATGNFEGNFMASSQRNGVFHEMLGRTADELDAILFPDSPFYRSFSGRSETYAEAVTHWINTVAPNKMRANLLEAKKKASPDSEAVLTPENNDAIGKRIKEICEKMNEQVREAYQAALKPYFDTIIKALYWNTGVRAGVLTGEKDSSGYIRVLQDGHLFYGVTMSKQRENGSMGTPDKTKLVFELATAKHIGANLNKEYKMVDGGVFLSCPGDLIEPPSSKSIIARNETVGAERVELQKAHDEIMYSGFCPYGYMAHSLYKILEFGGEHVEFFLGMRVNTRVRSNITIIDPQNCTSASTTLSTIGPEDYRVSADPIKFFKNEQRLDHQDKFLYLKFLKELYTKYIYTWSYICSLVVIRGETKGSPVDRAAAVKHNKEKIFAFVLARFLRVKAGDPGAPPRTDTPNIYELLPYGRYAGRLTDSKIGERMKSEYPKVSQNFLENCDYVYRSERLWCMKEAEEILVRDMLGDMLPEVQFTNLDIVHGYLLSENFVIDPTNSSPGYLSWKQYLTMSASVLYAKKEINESMGFLQGTFSALRKGSKPVFPEDSVGTESNFVQKDTITTIYEKDGEKKKEDVLELIIESSKVNHVILVNIANVPVYNENHSIGNNFMVSTLNEALSPANNFVLVLARSIHVKKPGKIFSFDFVFGKLPQSANGPSLDYGNNPHLDTRKNTSQKPGGPARSTAELPTVPREFMFQNGGPSVMLPIYGIEERTSGSTSSQKYNVNLTEEIRRFLDTATTTGPDGTTRPRYLSKAERSAQLVQLAAWCGRNTLHRSAPGAQRGSNKKTLTETIISYRTQVTPMITLSKDHRDSVSAEQHSISDKKKYIDALRP